MTTVHFFEGRSKGLPNNMKSTEIQGLADTLGTLLDYVLHLITREGLLKQLEPIDIASLAYALRTEAVEKEASARIFTRICDVFLPCFPSINEKDPKAGSLLRAVLIGTANNIGRDKKKLRETPLISLAIKKR